MVRPEDFDDVVRRLKLTPAQAARLKSAASRQDANLRVRLLPGDSLRGSRLRRSGDQLPALDELRQKLGPDLAAALSEIEPQVLRWVGSSEENARLFASDPLRGIEQAAPGFDRRKLARLSQLRRESAPSAPRDQTINLRNVTLVVDRPPRGR